jgi:diaminohydroxyphosphoribosylaminopyrimidine deaminase / 5-amino-6-(5-phosphoribosylamino)uracil reductase
MKPAFTEQDEAALAALAPLAERAVGLSDPNPRVGCQLLTLAGQTFSGHTQRAGEAHAEVVALRAAQQAGADVRGATAYVSLEPCSHHGRTPPCTDALLAAGVARVVVALPDPNPLVGGQGLERLRAAGVAVEVLPPEHPAAQAAAALNVGFLHRMRTGMPWVRMKVAASIDGITALPNGQSQWITGEAARTDGHAWRKRAGAVLTGIGTVLADDPRLDVRLVPTDVQPLRVVVDSRLEIPLGAQVLQAPGKVLVYAAGPDASRDTPEHTDHKRRTLRDLGITVVDLPGPGQKVDLPALVKDLGQREVNELHLEAGSKLNGSFMREGLVDEMLVYLAPMVLGAGAGMVDLKGLLQIEKIPTHRDWQFVDCQRVGGDLRMRVESRR